MQKPMNDTVFRLMSLEFKLKALLSAPAELLRSAGVEPGLTVLDFGCGPGRYTIPAARLVGPSGHVYAADLHPLALKGVERSARRARLGNLETVATDGPLPLPDGSIDLALLYDTLHDVEKRDGVVRELLRVLKPGGILSYRDHSLAVDSAFGSVIAEGFLEPVGTDGETTKLRRTGATAGRATPSAAAR